MAFVWQANLKAMDVISSLKPKYQAVMRIVFSTPREEVATVADALARGEGAASGIFPGGGPPRGPDASGSAGGSSSAEAGAGALRAGAAGAGVGSGARIDTGPRGPASLEAVGRTTKTFSPKKRK
jgi:hypothetical protein